jgi:hypothetical protein
MNLLAGLLDAFRASVIALGTCVLFCFGWVRTEFIALSLGLSAGRTMPGCMSISSMPPASCLLGLCASLYLFAFGSVYLPHRGRLWTAAAIFSLLLGVLLWHGISIYSMMTPLPR